MTELITPRLKLREFRLSDLEDACQFDCDPETQFYEEAHSPEEIHWKLQMAIQQSEEQPRNHYRFAVTVMPEDTVIGRLSLSLNNLSIREWEIGWTINRRCWGKGYAPEAAQDVIRFAFQELNAHRIVAFCNAGNMASVRVMQKCGMRQDGYLRETRWWHGGWADEFVYAIVEQDFYSNPAS